MFSLVLLFEFSRETWNVMAWDGLAQPSVEIHVPFHSSHGIPEISNQNFWLNGKHPKLHSTQFNYAFVQVLCEKSVKRCTPCKLNETREESEREKNSL